MAFRSERSCLAFGSYVARLKLPRPQRRIKVRQAGGPRPPGVPPPLHMRPGPPLPPPPCPPPAYTGSDEEGEGE